jgi:hypothetical protein
VTSEGGQATVEWTGLVLLATLVLGALAALIPRIDGRGLGESVAHAITCAARGGCAARPPPQVTHRPRPRAARPALPAPPAAPAGPPRSPLPAGPPRSALPAGPPRSALAAGPPRPAPPDGRAAGALQALRGAGEAAKKIWIVCLGYRRHRYELAHPRAPSEAMPLEETLDLANECLNPLGFLAWD